LSVSLLFVIKREAKKCSISSQSNVNYGEKLHLSCERLKSHHFVFFNEYQNYFLGWYYRQLFKFAFTLINPNFNNSTHYFYFTFYQFKKNHDLHHHWNYVLQNHFPPNLLHFWVQLFRHSTLHWKFMCWHHLHKFIKLYYPH